MNQLECMQMFVEVAAQARFSRAAATLHISPAKVSTQISNLEQYLGVQLLSRTTRTCTLTDDGKRYYAHCKRVLADMAETEALLSRSQQRPEGRLRINASITFINRLLLPVLGSFRSRYPGIELEVLHSEHVFDVQQEGFDVMLRLAAAVMGQGIYRGLRLGLDRLLSNGALKLILHDWVTPSPPILVAYEHHRRLSSRVRVFVDFMVKCFPPGKAIHLVPSTACDPLHLSV